MRRFANNQDCHVLPLVVMNVTRRCEGKGKNGTDGRDGANIFGGSTGLLIWHGYDLLNHGNFYVEEST